MAQVDMNRVVKCFGNQAVVRELTLSVEDGEFLVLVGPSGCGKSTVLRMLAGLESVTSGTLRIAGRKVNDLPPKDRDVGMVFQSYALYPHMTVFDNMAFGLTLRKVPRKNIESRVQEVAQLLGLQNLLHRHPRHLSGGERQRVAIGRVIVRSPQVFLFDEPLSNLDAALRVHMRSEIAKLHRQLGTTMIYVTHDQVEAMTLAQRIAVMKEGVLQQVAAPMVLYERPANAFVASFMGSPAMNLIHGNLSKEGGQVVFYGPGLRVPLLEPGAQKFLSREPVILGIRPHDLHGGKGVLAGEVTLVEPMGWESFAHVDTPAGKLVARLEAGQTARGGENLSLALDPQRLYLFDAKGSVLMFPQRNQLVRAA